jgi:hypothetical protein
LSHFAERFPAAQRKSAADILVSAMSATTEPAQLQWLATTLGLMVKQLSAVQAETAVKHLVEVMQNAKASNSINDIVRALVNLGEVLPNVQVEAITLRLINMIDSTTDRFLYDDLVTGLVGLSEHMSATQIVAVALRLVKMMERTMESSKLYILSTGLSKFGEHVSVKQDKSVTQHLVSVMQNTTDTYKLVQLGRSLSSLGVQLPVAQAEEAVDRLVAGMGNTTEPVWLRLLADALSALLDQGLYTEQAVAASQRLVDAMEHATDTGGFVELLQGWSRLSEQLPDAQLIAVVERLVAEMKTTEKDYQLKRLIEILVAFSERLSAAQAEAIGPILLNAMKAGRFRLDDIPQLGLLEAWANLAERVPTTLAAAGAELLLERLVIIDPNTGMSVLFGSESVRLPFAGSALPTTRRAIGEAFRAYYERLSATQVEDLARVLLYSMAIADYSLRISNYGHILGGLRELLPAAHAAAAMLYTVEAFARTEDQALFSELYRALRQLGKQLPTTLAETVTESTTVALGEATDRPLSEALEEELDQMASDESFSDKAVALKETLRQLDERLRQLAQQLPTTLFETVALRTIDAMGQAIDESQQDALEQVLSELVKRFAPAPAETVALHVVDGMKNARDGWQLSRLGAALGVLGDRLPPAQGQAGALRLVEAMRSTTDAGLFIRLAETLGSIPVPANRDAMDAAVDLLQAPMAYGETRTHLLRYFSRLAGVHETTDAFTSLDDLVAWIREHELSLDLNRPPRNPFKTRAPSMFAHEPAVDIGEATIPIPTRPVRAPDPFCVHCPIRDLR